MPESLTGAVMRHGLVYTASLLTYVFSIDGDQAYQMAQREVFEGTLTEEIFKRFAKPPKYELYDLTSDPYELYNLADNMGYKSTLSDLQNQLSDWLENMDAPR